MSSKEARAAAKAEREQAKLDRKSARDDIKAKVNVHEGASVEELIDIICGVDDNADLQKQSALAKLVKDPSLYKDNAALFHARIGEIFAGGTRINYLINEICEREPAVLKPYLGEIVERMAEPKFGSVFLPYVKKLSGTFPADMYAHLDRIEVICREMRGGSSIELSNLDIIGSMRNLKQPANVLERLLLYRHILNMHPQIIENSRSGGGIGSIKNRSF